MSSITAGVFTFLSPLVLLVALLFAQEDQKGLVVWATVAVLAVLSGVFFVNWLFVFWAFHLAVPSRRPRRSASAGAPRISLEWSLLNDFPESFAPLMSLRHLVARGEGVSGDLVDKATVTAEVGIRPGRHQLRVSQRAGLDLIVTERQAKKRVKLSVEAGRSSPDLEAVATSLVLKLPCLELAGVSEALDGLWELWEAKSGGPSFAGQTARHVCVLLLRALEFALPIRLAHAEGTACGDDFLLFFSGTVGPFPFVRIHLPAFILPRLHAHLAGLISEQPLVGQKVRKSVDIPAPHPAIVTSWDLSVDATVAPVGVNGLLRMTDGTVSTFSACFEEEREPLRLQCEAAGSLDSAQLKAEAKSFSVVSASQAKGICGAAAFTLEPLQKANLPDVLFEAICRKVLETPVEARTSVQLAAGSELPSAVRISFGDDHPLMLGGANIAAMIERAALHGTVSMRQELPVSRKRDLLQLPEVDMNFEAKVAVDDEKSFVDDGFATAWFQDVAGTIKGRLWSDAPDSVRAEADVHGAGRITAEVRDSSIVQALFEAESTAARWVGMVADAGGRPRVDSRTDLEDDGASGELFSVRPGDIIYVDVSGTANATIKGQVRTHKQVAGDLKRDSRSMLDMTKLRRMTEKTGLVRMNSDPDSPKVVLFSLAGSLANLELGEARARVGDLTLSLPSQARLQVHAREAELNAEGMGRTHMYASWENLGEPVVQHTARQLSAVLPPPPSSGGATVQIGDMGSVQVTYDQDADWQEFGNRVLDDEKVSKPILTLAAMLKLEYAVKKILNFARVVRNVMRTEGVNEPKDVIPADRMARFMSRIMLEIGTDGKHVPDEKKSPLELDIAELVRQAVDGKGIDVTKTTRLLWDYLPPEACDFVQHYTAEVDFAIKWVDSLLLPTEKYTGPDQAMALELPPSYKYRRELQEVAPCASRLYEALLQPGRLPREMELSLHKAAPWLSVKQIEFCLRHTKEMDEALHQRLQFLMGLKRRVAKVSEGYGGPAFMPQGMAVGFFLATAIRASFATPGVRDAGDDARPGQAAPRKSALLDTVAARLTPVLREQRAVMTEIARLQEYQQKLVEEAASVMGLDGAPASRPLALNSEASHPMRGININLSGSGTNLAADDEPQLSCMLDCLAPSEKSCILPREAIRSNAALMAQHQQAAMAQQKRAGGAGLTGREAPSNSGTTFDLGTSLLGPSEVAVLLQCGLAAVPQGRQVQQNQRMLIEIMVSQPPLFLKGVLYELSNNGSSRVLSNNLLALLDLKQDAVRPQARLDVADLLTTALGIQMPRRADFMAGGSCASNSYILFVNRAAKQVLEECQPYEALKYWLRRAEIPVQAVRAEMMPFAQRAVASALEAIKDADSAGSEWLQERGPVWAANGRAGEESHCQSKMRVARMLFETAFARCAAALKAHPEVLHAAWFKQFWSRNYDALMAVSVLRNLQQNVDDTRRWAVAQVKYASKCSTYEGPSTMGEELWQTNPASEACCLDCLIEILFFQPEDREKFRKDSLMQLIIDEAPGHFDFTVVSAMGVITEGAAGREMAPSWVRLLAQRGVSVVRADTATLQSVDYNAIEIQKAVRDHVRTPWGWCGYSQGCANAFRAEAMMLQGTPAQQKLMENFRCRQMLFSAANGSAHATCGEWKILRALCDGERFLKRFQASMSASTQHLALDLLQNMLSSHSAFTVLGSVQSLSHEGARRVWRDGQHCHRVPTTSMIGVIEEHTLPECLKFVSKILLCQMDYSQCQDTQVSMEEAVGYPTGIKNSNAELLAQCDMRSAVHRTNHWSPLKEEAAFLETEWDREHGSFDTPKDRHIFPWLEVNARFGVIDRVVETQRTPRRMGG